MLDLANQARSNNMSSEDIIGKTIRDKAKLINKGLIEYNSMCSDDQIKEEHYATIFDEINHGLNPDVATSTAITDDDIVTGFMIFSATVYCTETVPLYQFLHRLISSQSPRTVIKAIVNTIQSDNIRERKNRKLLNQFFLALDKIFHFQIGKILLATSSLSQLQSMIAKDWPFFNDYSKEIDQCFNGSSCLEIMNLVQTLGKETICLKI